MMKYAPNLYEGVSYTINMIFNIFQIVPLVCIESKMLLVYAVRTYSGLASLDSIYLGHAQVPRTCA